MVRQLPAGTVTFLFTDIEGSTRLLQERGDDYAGALAGHRRAVERAVSAHGGVVVDTEGDAFFVAFARAADAVAAAEAAQRALDVPVRMGIHTGEPVLTDEGYVGIDVHRAARICSAAHGGQVLVSETTQRLLDGASNRLLLDLGEHLLKDLGAPVRLYQLGAGEFAPLRTLNQTNLPPQPTPLVGRERELEELLELARAARLVTVTGPGGSGKTRLALQAAAELVDEFAGGVFFVALAPLDRAELVVPTVAKTLGLREAEDEPVEQTLEAHLADRRLLLVLDNFERLLDAAAAVARLLASAPGLSALATSRIPLHLAGEREYAVPPLDADDSLELFAARARAVKSGFTLDEESEPAVREVCARLDGLPLAIELAAARARLLSPQALLERLERRLPLLTGGARDAPGRQQTLRAAIDWSYELLDEPERRLFRRLGVFAGGCSVESAEAVCEATIDEVESLVDKSLLRATQGAAGDPRTSMLQTIREYAAERLDEAGEGTEVRRLHANHYCAFAEAAEPEILGAEQALWLDRLQDELDNFRAALEWSLEREPGLALRMIGSLRRAWVARGYLHETRGWLEAALARADGADVPARAKALYGLGRVALAQADYDVAAEQLDRAAALYRRLDHAEGIVYSLADLASVAAEHGEPEQAERTANEALEIARSSDDPTLIAAALHSLARAVLDRGDAKTADRLFGESVELRRSLGDTRNTASSLGLLGLAALVAGDHGRATDALEESLALGRQLGNRLVIAAALANLALAALVQEERDRARSLAVESLELARDLGDKRTVIECLHVLADVAGAEDPARAATLAGAADALHAAISAPPSPAERLLGGEHAAHEDSRRKGWALTLDQAIAVALEPEVRH